LELAFINKLYPQAFWFTRHNIAALRLRIRQVFRVCVEYNGSLVLKHTRPQVLQGVLFAPARRKKPLPVYSPRASTHKTRPPLPLYDPWVLPSHQLQLLTAAKFKLGIIAN
jgi:hypothetical protein